MFISSAAFTVCMSSVWPFLKILDRNANATFLGYVVAAYSVGQIVAAPGFGTWATWRKQAREPLMVSMAIFIGANALYAYLQDFKENAPKMMIVARLLIGIGGGNIAVVRSYVAAATDIHERTTAMANVAMSQALGFVLGPAIQTAMVPLNNPGPVEIPYFHLNFYTAPAFFSVLVGIVNLLLVIFAFKEYNIQAMLEESGADNSRKHEDEVGTEGTSDNKTIPKLESSQPRKPDYWACAICVVVFFTVLFMFSVFETMTTPLGTDILGLTEKQATLDVGLLFIGSGILSIITFIVIKPIAKRVDERVLLVVALIGCVIGFLVYIPYGSEPVQLKMMSMKFPNGTEIHSDLTIVGCPYEWCKSCSKIYFFQIIIAGVIMAAGYPISNLMITTLFSKILGPISQGLMMGVLSASGSLGRLVGPLFVTAIYQTRGPRDTFIIIGGVVFATLLLVIGTYRRIIPYKEYWRCKQLLNNNFNTQEEVRT